jgi:trehalose synthase-fused probable maltokinase
VTSLGRFEPPFGPDSVRQAVAGLSAEWLGSRRWFGGKSRRISGLSLADHAVLSAAPPAAVLALVEVEYGGGSSDVYALPLLFSDDGLVLEASDDEGYDRLLFRLLAQGAERGPARFEAYVALPDEPSRPKPLGVEQSNTSIAYGRDWILKLYRHVEFGENRDLEVGRFLTLDAGFPHTPQVAGAISYQGGGATLGVLQRFVPNEGDCWGFVRRELDLLVQDTPNAPDDVYWAQDGLPDRGGYLLDQVELLGRVTGELHHALASRGDLPLFAPEPCGEADLAGWLADLEGQRSRACASAEAVSLPDEVRSELAAVCQAQLPPPAALTEFTVHKIQVHGDYHLGQVLTTAAGFAVIDFAGEPARPLEERRAKQPALRDVAGMLRSLHYAAWATALAAPDRHLGPWAERWTQAAGQRFLAGWRSTSGEPLSLPLLQLFQLAKAYYELNYELNNRPDWVAVPLRGIRSLLPDV